MTYLYLAHGIISATPLPELPALLNSSSSTAWQLKPASSQTKLLRRSKGKSRAAPHQAQTFTKSPELSGASNTDLGGARKVTEWLRSQSNGRALGSSPSSRKSSSSSE